MLSIPQWPTNAGAETPDKTGRTNAIKKEERV